MRESGSIWWTKPATAQSEERQRQEEEGLRFLLRPLQDKKKQTNMQLFYGFVDQDPLRINNFSRFTAARGRHSEPRS